MDLAGNLKRLRKERDMTQEDLSELFNITFQAVSKWERGESYPDITLLPSIAEFFNVSIDELIGANQTAKKDKRDAVLEKWQQLILPPNASRIKAADYLREQLRDFPQDWDLWLKLAFCLEGMYEAGSPFTTGEDHHEAIRIYERIQKFCVDDGIRMDAMTGLTRAYKRIGALDKAVEVARKLPSYSNSREHILPALLNGEEQLSEYQFVLTGLVSWFMLIMRKLAEEDQFGYSIDERITILEKGIAINKIMTEGDDASFLPGQNQSMYFLMAFLAFEDNQPERALEYLYNSANNAIMWAELGREHQYKSLLMNRRNRNQQWALDSLENPVDGLLYVLTTENGDMRWPALDPYRGDVRLDQIIEKLKPYASTADK
jgi:transcriptional regulator with XRE-family HTH domain